VTTPSGRSLPSRFLHRVSAASASTAAAVSAATVSAAFFLGALLGPTTEWLTAFESFAAAVTLIMVFVLQHNQSREQLAVQRKLDELLRALPGADPKLMRLEAASDHDLGAVDRNHVAMRREAIRQGS
jgi:low affinity Fe/Cu permease